MGVWVGRADVLVLWVEVFVEAVDERKDSRMSDSRCSGGFSTSACQGQITLMVPSAVDVPVLALKVQIHSLPYLSNALAPAGMCVKEVRGSPGASVREQKTSISDVVT